MKKIVLNEAQIKKAIERIAHSLIEKEDVEECGIIGIRTRGVHIGRRIMDIFYKKLGKTPLFGTLDITLYRDDFVSLYKKPKVEKTELLFDIGGRCIILVDDVLYTGRTVRAALDELVDFGRPKKILLVVLVDRGGRELPIHADFIGKKIDVPPNHWIEVRLKEVDGEDVVLLHERRSTP